MISAPPPDLTGCVTLCGGCLASLALALRHEVAEVVRVPELHGRLLPGLGVSRAAVLAGPAQRLQAAIEDSPVARVGVPRAR